MKLQKNINALTLVELIAAGMITVFMMIAIASMDISLRNLFDRSTKDGMVVTRLSAVINHVSQRLANAVGDQTGLSGWGEGVAANPNAGTLHIQLENSPAETPENYSDNDWVLYTFDSITHELRYCTTTSISGSCGTILKTFPNITYFRPELIEDNTMPNRKFFVFLTLKGCYDASQGISPSNPEKTLTSSISLPDSSHTIP